MDREDRTVIAKQAHRLLLAELEIACDRRKNAAEVASRHGLTAPTRDEFFGRVAEFRSRARVPERSAPVDTPLVFSGEDTVGSPANSQDAAALPGRGACTGKERGK